nr:hypothetical protein [Tanacetum cinerariifolium]
IKAGMALGYNREGCMGNSQFDFASISSRGRSGGILCIWNKVLFQKQRVLSVDNFVAVQGCWMPIGLDIMFIAVYAPKSVAGKIDFWASLSRLIANWDGNVIVMGDFNEVREAGERYGSVFHERQADTFNSFIKNLNLIDIPLGGFRYTWSDKWASKMSKLDRILINEGVQDAFPHITVIVLEKGVPDNRPILIKESVVDYGPTPFRFFHSWLDVKGFQDLVVDTWKNYDSMETNGMMRKEHQALLSLIDVKVDQGSATPDDINARVSSMKVLSDIVKKEASDLAQKAKIKWAIEEPGKVKDELYDHFSNRFACTCGPRPRLGLHASIHKAVDVGIFKGASIGQGNLVLSQLFYVDDAIFVGEWSQSNSYNLICMLRCFYLVSGLNINVNKSKLLGMEVYDVDVVDMAKVLAYGVSKLPMMYLGVPVGGNMGRCEN